MLSMKSESGWKDFFINFFARRTLRIFPLYFIYLIIVAGACLLLPFLQQNANGLAFIQSMPWSFTYTYNFYHASSHFEPSQLVTHFWSLAVEEQFYLVFPFMVFLTPARRIKQLLLCIITAGPLLRFLTAQIVTGHLIEGVGHAEDVVIYVSPLSHLDAFATGGFFAMYMSAKDERFSWWAILICLLTGFASQYLNSGSIRPIGALGFPAFMNDKMLWGYSLINFLFGFLILQTRDGKFMHAFLSNSVFNYLGRISYGLYVFHFPCLFVVHDIMSLSGTKYVNDIVALALAISLAALSYRFVESRFIAAKDRYFPRRPVHRPAEQDVRGAQMS